MVYSSVQSKYTARQNYRIEELFLTPYIKNIDLLLTIGWFKMENMENAHLYKSYLCKFSSTLENGKLQYFNDTAVI